MRILLLNPPLIRSNSAVELAALDDEDNSCISLGLYSLAAVLIKAGHEVRLLNHALVTWSNSLAEAAAFRPEMVGITCMSHHRTAVMAWPGDFKKLFPTCRIVLGGVHASVLYADILERIRDVDFIAIGEAETSLLELAGRLDKGESPHGIRGIAGRLDEGSIDYSRPASLICNLGELPIPAEHFPYSIITSARGCPFDCTFCSSRTIWGAHVRERPVEHVIRELALLRHKHHLTQVAFKDETFTLKKGRVREICQAMIDAKLDLWWTCDTRVDCLDEESLYWMRKAGCFYVSFGVESGSERMLGKINKRTSLEKIVSASAMARKFGMLVRYYMIVGLPDESQEDLRASLDLIERAKPTFVFAAPLSISPGTEVCREYYGRKGLGDEIWFQAGPSFLLYDTEMKWNKWPEGQALMACSNLGQNKAKREPLNPLTEAELREAQSRLSDCFAPNYDLALFLRDHSRCAEAIPYYEHALELRPAFAKGHLDLGVCYDAANRLGEAVAQWEQVERIADDPDLPPEPLENVALSLVYRGVAAMASNDWVQAITFWKQAHERHPRSIDPLRLIAENCAQNGLWLDAQIPAERWAKLDPKSGQAIHIVALCYMMQGLAEDADLLFLKAHELAPDNAEILYNHALLITRSGRLPDALQLARQALSINPAHESAQNLLREIQAAVRNK